MFVFGEGKYINLGGGFKYFYFHPYLGKISNLTEIFQMSLNHQPEMDSRIHCNWIMSFLSLFVRPRFPQCGAQRKNGKHRGVVTRFL